LQAKLDSIDHEHGDAYIEGIQPRFDILKARHFDSSWNWVRQDALLMYYDIIFALLNRADPDMLQFMQYNINRCDASKGETYRLAKEFGQKLIHNTREVIGKPLM
jgi:fatty acid synthase subunit alpha